MKSNRKHIVPASALGYAITFLLLVGLFTSGVLFISSTHKRIETHFLGREYLLFDNYTSLLYGAKCSESGTYQLYHPSGDTSMILVKPWGFMKSTVVKTYNGNNSIQRVAFTIMDSDDTVPCLYMPDQKRKIALGGTTRLEGTVFAAERSLERANITGKPFKSDQLVYGSLKKSERYLPPLKKSVIENELSYLLTEVNTLEALNQDSTFAFDQKTSLFRSNEAIQISQNLKGNLIIQSFDRIFVASNAILEHVILLAPSVFFEKGFHGKVQVIASHEIVCEEDVHLDYPSALMLFEDQPIGQQSRISLMKDAQVLGGVLLVSKNPDFRNPVFLEVLDATIGGLVYNQGETEIRGEIIGSLYTNKLVAHAGGGVYGGHLVDALISSKQLPPEFIYPNWLRDTKVSKPILLTCI